MVTDFTKQEELIDVNKFDQRINVVGCGSLGSWLTFFLLKMGFKDIHVYDFDTVEEHNLPNQLFCEDDIEKYKVNAMQDIYYWFFNDEIDKDRINIHKSKIDSSNASSLKGTVFSCVDSMKARKEIYENCFKYGLADLWIEGRLSLFGAYVYTLDRKDEVIFNEYDKTLYDDEETEVSVCGVSQTALPSAVNAASTMLMQMINYHRGNDVTHQVQYAMPEFYTLNKRW